MKGSAKEVLVFSEELNQFSYGIDHPLRIERLQLTMDLMKAYGLFDDAAAPWVEASPAEESDLLLFHKQKYLQILEKADAGVATERTWMYGLASGDNPVFPGLYRWSRLVTGATLESVRQALDGAARIAFNISGGLHHAMPDKASGFCYINDPAVGIAFMLQKGLRVAYVDVDAHHGDGVEAAFYNTDRVLTISLHQHGRTLFPGTGFPEDIGRGPGKGYAVNIPLAPGTDDKVYMWAFMEVVPPLLEAFDPDILVTQLGVDGLAADPLTALNLTLGGYLRLVREMKSWNRKWVALGGGGYNILNVAKGWTQAWAIMKAIEIPGELPAAFVADHPSETQDEADFFDLSFPADTFGSDYARETAEEAVSRIKKSVFPVLGL